MPSASVRHAISLEIECCPMQRMHTPLVRQAIQVLRTLQIISGRPGLHFPGERGA